MGSLVRLVAVSTLCLVPSAGCGKLASKDTVEFRFAPPLGFVGEERSSASVSLSRTSAAGVMQRRGRPLRTVMQEIFAELRVEKGDTWQVAFVSRPTESRLVIDEEEMGRGHPFIDALLGATLVRDVWEEGKFAGVRGYHQLSLRLLRTLDDRDFDLVGLTMTHRLAERVEKGLWADRIEPLIGQKLRIGSEVRSSTARCDVPFGSVPCEATLKVVERKPAWGRDCVLLQFSYSVRDKDEGVPVTLDAASQRGGVGTVYVLSLEGSGERLIDPSTLMLYRENHDKKVVVSVERQTTTIKTRATYHLTPRGGG